MSTVSPAIRLTPPTQAAEPVGAWPQRQVVFDAGQHPLVPLVDAGQAGDVAQHRYARRSGEREDGSGLAHQGPGPRAGPGDGARPDVLGLAEELAGPVAGPSQAFLKFGDRQLESVRLRAHETRHRVGGGGEDPGGHGTRADELRLPQEQREQGIAVRVAEAVSRRELEQQPLVPVGRIQGALRRAAPERGRAVGALVDEVASTVVEGNALEGGHAHRHGRGHVDLVVVGDHVAFLAASDVALAAAAGGGGQGTDVGLELGEVGAQGGQGRSAVIAEELVDDRRVGGAGRPGHGRGGAGHGVLGHGQAVVERRPGGRIHDRARLLRGVTVQSATLDVAPAFTISTLRAPEKSSRVAVAAALPTAAVTVMLVERSPAWSSPHWPASGPKPPARRRWRSRSG